MGSSSLSRPSDQLDHRMWLLSDSIIDAFHNIHELDAINMVDNVRAVEPNNFGGIVMVVTMDNSASRRPYVQVRHDLTLGACVQELLLLVLYTSFYTSVVQQKAKVELEVTNALSHAHSSPVTMSFTETESTYSGLTRIYFRQSPDFFTLD